MIERNVITVEDPVEVEVDGITQVQVSEAFGVTFEAGLRAALRQDPDVVMIGEIRDTTTGGIAVRAALTGHLVLSTLHTNDAPSAVTRLIDLGIARYLVSSSLSLVLAQRLLRRNCSFCCVAHQPSADVRYQLGLGPDVSDMIVAGTGCPACDGTGYRGRIGAFELLVVNDDFRAAIADGAGEGQLRDIAVATGWRPIQEQGIRLIMQGITTPEEVLRATQSEGDPGMEPRG